MITEEFLDKHFYNKFYKLNEATILKLNKASNDPSINNVVVGRQYHLYGVGLNDEEQSNDFQLYYINGEHELTGNVLKLNINDPNRDTLITAFSMHLADNYNIDVLETFNTYQEYIASTFENLGFMTLRANDLMKYKDSNPMVVAKNVKGILVMPYLYHKDLFKFLFGSVNVITPIAGESYVYLMHNSKNNYIKIGKSINPTHREKTLQAEEPEITMIAVWKVSEKLEKHLHKLYRHKRMRGEWFNLTFKELKEIKQHVHEFIKHSVA
jgi:hypothetical protein